MRTHSRLHPVLLGVASVAIVACGPSATTTPRPSASAAPLVGGSASPAASAGAGPSPSASASTTGRVPDAWLLVGQAGRPRLQLVMAQTGEVQEMTVPDGVPAEHWSRVVTATADGSSTTVRDEIVQPGTGGPQLRLDGAWQLPTVGLDPLPVGRSLDGSTIVLVEPADATPGRSRFAIVEHWLMDAVQIAGDTPLRLARIVDLPGDFEYDALSPDGRILYVVQRLDATVGGHYQVRAVDVSTGVLRDGVIVDKGDPDTYMAGSALAQLRRADGLVLTLYSGPDHPFIHALNSKEAWALCIDLPAANAVTGTDLAARSEWGLAESASGSAVYAVNTSLGLVVDVDPNEFAVRRMASIATAATGPTIALAKFGHGAVGPTGRRLVMAPDGALLFAAGTSGLTVIRARDLTFVRSDPLGPVEAVAVTPDGMTVFALTRDGRIVAVDSATGAPLGTVPGSGYDRLLAVAPW